MGLMKKDKFYTVTQLAKALGYSRYGVYKMIDRGLLKVEAVGRWTVIPEKEYLRILDVKRKAVKKGKVRAFFGKKAKSKRGFKASDYLG